MKNIILSCPSLKGELTQALRLFGADIPVFYLPSRLHSSPRDLRKYLQMIIDGQTDVDQILICVSGCGGSTSGLKATTARLVIPKTRDCIDILLSQNSATDIPRAVNGMFLTESWMGFFKDSSLDYQTMVKKLGRERAEERLKAIYDGFNHFYIIDTGIYDLTPVREYIQPLVELLDGTVEVIPGYYGILKKMVSGKIDEDFHVVPKGSVSK